MKKHLIRFIAVIFTFFGLNATLMAQSWAELKQVKIVIPYPPGSEPDILARELSMALQKNTGKTYVVENRPGANGIIGINYVAKSKGDGSTLLLVDTLAIATNPLLFKSLSYDWEKDLTPIKTIAGTHLYLLVKKDFPADSYQDFIKQAKTRQDHINIGTGGQGHITHLGMGRLAQQENISFTYIPYRGMSPASNALLGGEIDALLAGGLLSVQSSQSGKVKILAVGAENRTELLPNIATIAELGGPKNSHFSTTFSLFAPGDSPAQLTDALAQAVTQALNSDEMQKSFSNRGLIQIPSSTESITAQIHQDQNTYRELLPTLGIVPE